MFCVLAIIWACRSSPEKICRDARIANLAESLGRTQALIDRGWFPAENKKDRDTIAAALVKARAERCIP